MLMEYIKIKTGKLHIQEKPGIALEEVAIAPSRAFVFIWDNKTSRASASGPAVEDPHGLPTRRRVSRVITPGEERCLCRVFSCVSSVLWRLPAIRRKGWRIQMPEMRLRLGLTWMTTTWRHQKSAIETFSSIGPTPLISPKRIARQSWVFLMMMKYEHHFRSDSVKLREMPMRRIIFSYCYERESIVRDHCERYIEFFKNVLCLNYFWWKNKSIINGNSKSIFFFSFTG